MNTKSRHILPALKTATIYGIFGGLWILLSDQILGFLVSDLDTYATIQTYKGWLYIVITAGLVFHLVASNLKQAIEVQDELQISEERYLLALEGANVGTWDWDIETGDVVFNDVYARMLGYDPNAFPPIYESWEALLHPDDKRKVLDRLQRHLDGETDFFTSEFRLLTADKQWKWIMARGKVFRWDERGQPSRAVGVHIDLSERRAAEEALEIAKEAAEAASLARGQFLSKISHEIRTPLSGLMGMLLLMKDFELPKQASEYLATADSAGQALLSIVDDVLHLTQIENKTVPVCEEGIDLPILAETVQRVFKSQLESSNVDLEFTLDKNIPDAMCGDQGKLRQILFNLVGNALKCTQNGSIHVDVTAVNDRRNTRGIIILFTVSDTGVLVPESVIKRAFNARVPTLQSQGLEYDGAGLGLRIVTHLIPLLGGTICMESEEDVGTTVHFAIPAQKLNHSLTQTAQAHETAPSRELRVLLVEDDPVNRIASTRFLEKLGHVPTAVGNGKDALDRFRTTPFDFILLDIQMPGMDGLQVANAIRNSKGLGERAKVPIIACTAHAMPEDRERYLKQGLDGYVTKPTDLNALRKEIDRVMKRRK